jgi:flagellar assembly factor FliW
MNMDSTTIQGGTEIPAENEANEIEGDSQDPIFFFEDGILGFPACRRFTLNPAEAEGFHWLRSVECDSLAFLLVDPFRAVEGFFVDLGDTDLHHLQTNDAPEIGVMAIVTLPNKAGEAPTANLQGVVAFNFKKHLGRQIIIQDSPYDTRWPLDLSRLSMAS